MKTIKSYIEQLEEAGEQLNKNTTTGARLALLLLDNLVELLMYRRVRREFFYDNQFPHYKSPKYSQEKKKRVLEDFKEKVNFLVTHLKELDENTASVLKVGHALRNEAYHYGILREGIILSVTKTYFEIVCNLISKLWSGTYSYSNDEATGFLSKYGILDNFITDETLNKVTAKIPSGDSSNLEELISDLSYDLTFRINEIIDSLNYLTSNSNLTKNLSDTLKWLQFWETDIAKGKNNWPEINKLYADYVPPRINEKRLLNWKSRGERIYSEKLAGIAMKKWHEIDRILKPLETTVHDAVYQFDEYINMQIHDR